MVRGAARLQPCCPEPAIDEYFTVCEEARLVSTSYQGIAFTGCGKTQFGWDLGRARVPLVLLRRSKSVCASAQLFRHRVLTGFGHAFMLSSQNKLIPSALISIRLSISIRRIDETLHLLLGCSCNYGWPCRPHRPCRRRGVYEKLLPLPREDQSHRPRLYSLRALMLKPEAEKNEKMTTRESDRFVCLQCLTEHRNQRARQPALKT